MREMGRRINGRTRNRIKKEKKKEAKMFWRGKKTKRSYQAIVEVEGSEVDDSKQSSRIANWKRCVSTLRGSGEI